MRKDSFFGLDAWEDDDVDQLAVQFLTSERQHSARLERMIDAHLHSLRIDADLGSTSERRPIVPTVGCNGIADQTVIVPAE